MDQYASQALAEYNSDTHTVRRAGVCGKPFWNANASQFTFVPQFMFPALPGADYYIYTATDKEGALHTFQDPSPIAALTPIWSEIPTGLVTLRVEAHHKRSGKLYPCGARSFFKCPPFPGRSALPARARSYRECARLALRYVFRDPTTRHWLEHGTPDPNYYHNVYPSKMIASIIGAMLTYASIAPEDAEEAVRLATRAADYLLSITYGEDSLLAGLPPTYSFLGLNKEIVDQTAPAAEGRRHMLMTIYPASVGSAYLKLEAATGDGKYFEAAKRIAEYYKRTVLASGSWYLLIDERTGKQESVNTCVHFAPLAFLEDFYKRTGEECYLAMAKRYFAYIEKTCLENYNWEGQFEDVALSGNYTNLTHLNADKVIGYIAAHESDDPERIKTAEELLRFVEDQFVIWGEYPPWNPHRAEGAYWHAPAALEQYTWYVPIDGSTVTVMRAFLDLYAVKKDRLLLEKACALGDAVTRLQDPESGVIPTHWMSENCHKKLENFWINCHIGSALQMLHLAEVMGE